jgi:hypothetical protein
MSTDATTLPIQRADVAEPLWRERMRPLGRVLRQPALQARAGLALIVAASAFIVAAAAGRPSFLSAPTQAHYFPAWMAGPLGGIWPALTASASLRWLVTVAVVLAYAGYVVAVKHARHLRIGTVAKVIVAVQVIYLIAPPLALTDVFNYLNYARMEVVHHLNPYTTIPQLEPHSDPAFALSNWHGLLSPYGPLFTILTFTVATFSLAAYFWTFKAAILVAELGIVFLTYKCAQLLQEYPLGAGAEARADAEATARAETDAEVRADAGTLGALPHVSGQAWGGRWGWTRMRPAPIDPVAAVVFVGLNPIVLFWGVGGDHNDFFTVFSVVLGFYLLLRARAAGMRAPTLALGAPTLAQKAPGLDQGARTLQAPGHAGRRWMGSPAALDMGAGAAFVLAAGMKASLGLLIPIVLVSLLGSRRRLLCVLAGMGVAGVLAAAGTLIAFGVHFPNLTLQNSLVTDLSVPNLLGLALGQGGETGMLHNVLTIALVGSLVACCVLAWRRRESLTGAGWAMVVVLVTLSWILPWYLVWVLPMAALAGSRRLRMATVALGVYFIIAWAPATSEVLGKIGFHPQHTTIGRIHAEAVEELLY